MAKRSRKSSDIETRLGKADTPLFVVDCERRVQVFNAGCEAVTGWSASEVLGQRGHYASPLGIPGALALASSLCPPPEAFLGSELIVPAQVAHKEGHVIARTLHFFPLQGASGEVTGVLGVISANAPQPPARASAARELHAELAAVRATLRVRFSPEALVAHDAAMRKALNQVELAQQCAAFVLLEGEPGTGKEHLARTIHFGSPSRANWFVPLDCRRLGADELERVWNRLLELHTPSTYSASPLQPGAVYMSDVEYLPRDLQERLAVAFGPGDPEQRPRIRILGASTHDLCSAAQSDRLRPDFYAMLSTLTISVPPLRKRGGDVQLLAQYFLEELNRQGEKQVGGFDDEAWRLLLHYPWPGNLDELAAVVGEAHARTAETLIAPGDLPFRFRTAFEALQVSPPPEAPPLLLDPLLTRVETQLITLALERSKFNKSKAATLLGINRARLLRRIEQLNIADPKAVAEEESDSEEGSP